MKKRKYLPFLLAFVGVFTATQLQKSKSVSPVQAAYGTGETVTIYLDTTVTVAGLSWWDTTDKTFIGFESPTVGWTHTAMTRVSSRLFSYTLPSNFWDGVTGDGQGKIEFNVHNYDNPQNSVWDADINYLKNNEFNFFVLNTANGGAKQGFDLKNKEVEDVVADVFELNCDVSQSFVQNLVTKYNNLTLLGKSKINEWQIGDEGSKVSMYQRLEYYAAFKGVSLLGDVNQTYNKDDNNLTATIIIGVIGLSTLVGYYFITKKSKVTA